MLLYFILPNLLFLRYVREYRRLYCGGSNVSGHLPLNVSSVINDKQRIIWVRIMVVGAWKGSIVWTAICWACTSSRSGANTPRESWTSVTWRWRHQRTALHCTPLVCKSAGYCLGTCPLTGSAPSSSWPVSSSPSRTRFNRYSFVPTSFRPCHTMLERSDKPSHMRVLSQCGFSNSG